MNRVPSTSGKRSKIVQSVWHRTQDMALIDRELRCERMKHLISSLPYGPSSSKRMWVVLRFEIGSLFRNDDQLSRCSKIFPKRILK